MTSPASDFLVNLAANLAYDLIKTGSARLSRSAFMDEEQQMLRQAYQHAFTVMLTGTMHHLDAEMQDHVGDILRRYVESEDTAGLLLDLAISNGELQLDDLKVRFEDVGFDLSTLPVDFDLAIKAFVSGLAEGLRLEAARAESPLFNRVSLGRLTAIELLLQENTKSWRDVLLLLHQLEAGLEAIKRREDDHDLISDCLSNTSSIQETIPLLPAELQPLANGIQRLLQAAEEADSEIEESLTEYSKALTDYCNQLPYVTLPGKPLPLLSTIYIEQRSEEQLALNDLETTNEHQPQNSVETIEQALQRHRHLIVEGGPGMGKSTMLHHLSLTLTKDLNNESRTKLVPIRVVARDLVTRGGSLSESLHQQVTVELGKRLRKPLSPDFFANPPAKDMTWLVMLDGLDEIISQTDREELMHAVTLHARMEESYYRFIITTRPLTGSNWFDRTLFGYYVVLPFEPRQVRAFVLNWFTNRPGSDQKEAEFFLTQLEGSRVEDITRIPLLITMAVVVYELDRAKELPAHRIDLYHRFVTVLLEDEECTRETREDLRRQWDKRYGNEGQLSADTLFNNRLSLLEHLARWQQLGHTGSMVEESLRFAREKNWIAQSVSSPWAYEQMETLLRRTGLLIKRGNEETFIHTSFREYLAASAFARIHQPDDPAACTILDQLAKENWWEIVVFMLAIWSKRGHDVTKAAQHILDHYGRAGLLFTGTAFAEGAVVSPETGNSIIDRMLGMASRMHNIDLQDNPNPVKVLGRLRDSEKVMSGLFSLVCDSKVNVLVGQQAAQALLQLGYKHEAVKAFMFLTLQTNVIPSVRKSAIKTLNELGHIQDLVEFAYDESISLAARIFIIGELRMLGTLKDVKIELFLSQIVSDETVELSTRVQAAQQWYGLNKSPVSCQFLHDIAINPATKINVRLNIARFFYKHRLYMEVMLSICADPSVDAETRLFAGNFLNYLGKTNEVLQMLVAIVEDDQVDEGIRFQAIRQLERIGKREMLSPEFELSPVYASVALNSSFAVETQIDAAIHLYALTRHDYIVQLLYEFGQDPAINPLQRLKIAKTFAVDHPESAVSILLCLIHDPDVVVEIKLRANKNLASLLESDSQALSLLVLRSLDDGDIKTRLVTAHQSDQLNTNDHEIDALYSLIYNEQISISLRVGLLEALLHMHLLENDAIAILLTVTTDSSIMLEDRIRALRVLERFGQVNEILDLAVSNNLEKQVRKTAIKVLGHIGVEASLPKLNQLARLCGDKDIRRAATHAISRIHKRLEANVESPSEQTN